MSNTFTRQVGIEHPVIQGPLGSGNSTPQLVAGVSNAGGLGSFGAYHLSPDDILRTAAAIRDLTTRPFALNLWVSNHDPDVEQVDAVDVARVEALLRPFYDELAIEPPLLPRKTVYPVEDQMRAVLEARPAVLSVAFGVPPADVMRDAKRRGIQVAGTATTLDEARVLDDAGVDLIVATGLEAGGHRPSFLAPAEDSLVGTLSLTTQLAACVRKPVIAAGGIAHAKGVAAVLQLGASAAQVGTAFLACDESGAPAFHRDLLFTEQARRTVLTRAYTGRLGRGFHVRVHDALRGAAPLPFPAQAWLVGALRDAAIARQRADLATFWCGQSASLLRWRTVAEVMASLVE